MATSKIIEKPETSLPEILTKKELETFLRVSKRTVDYLVASRSLPSFKVGKRALRFTRGQVLKWVATQEASRIVEGGDAR